MNPMKQCLLPLLLILLLAVSPAASAKTYVITDGARTLTYTPGEKPSPEPEIVSSPVPLRQVLIQYHGARERIFTEADTVGQLLDRLGLEILPEDRLSHPQDAPVADGMTLRVDTILTQRETYTVTLSSETLYCTDDTLPGGMEQVLVEGREGELLCTAEVTYINGQETQRKILSSRQTIAPVHRLIARGTAPASNPPKQDMPIIEDGYILMPSGERVTYYKTDNVTATGYTHTDAGCDMITATGTTVHYGTAAVDPRFIPYGTRMLIVSHDGQRFYGIATAEDCGGAIKRDKMDLYFPTYQECIEFGRRRCTVYFLG